MIAREHRLEVACKLTDVLIAVESQRRRTAALALVEQSEFPTAVLDVASRLPILVNTAWRLLFGTRDAYTAIRGVDDMVRTRVTTHFRELALELGDYPAYGAATLYPSRDEIGEVTTVVVVCTDITDEVLARRLAVDADALVWSGPLGSGPDYFNRRWSAYSSNAQGWQHVIHPADIAKCNEGLRWAARECGSIDIEARLSRANEGWHWHRVRFEIATSGTRWFGTAVDIHDARTDAAERNELLARERTARADAEEANRLKDQFLGVVSHELRAPLTTMVLWESILRDSGSDATMRSKALDAIRQSALTQSRVVGDLLDVSRAIAGKLLIDLRSVEVEVVVREALDAIAPEVLAKQITLERRGDLTGVSVQADAIRLRQVLVNLLSNAVKFTDRNGRVTLGLARRGRSIAISVEDTGHGIEPELLAGLFEPFSQTNDSTTHRGDGLGLGLAIAKQLVELHHGTIEATSAGAGAGTTLTIVLPAGGLAATPRAGLPMPHGLELARARVLVVDDDQRVRDALALLLHRAGAVVETAHSAETARVQIARGAPQVLVCDIGMPVEDGYSFMSGLRSAGSDLPAIALTAYATSTDVERALAAGFDRHLAKPIDIEKLIASIGELVGGRQASADASRTAARR